MALGFDLFAVSACSFWSEQPALGMIRGAQPPTIMPTHLDLTGHVYGQLTVEAFAGIQRVGKVGQSQRMWRCSCSCGQKTTVSVTDLRSGHTRSCGCLKSEDLLGRKFGRLLVVAAGPYVEASGGRIKSWICRCKCGNQCTVRAADLKKGDTQSCGCLLQEVRCRPRPANRSSDPEGVALRREYKNHAYNAQRRDLAPLPYEDWLRLSRMQCAYCAGSPTPRYAYLSASGNMNSGVIDIEWARLCFTLINGIDRADNSIGYESGNCVPCCTRCNSIKLDQLTYDEMMQLAPTLRLIREQREAATPASASSPESSEPQQDRRA